MTNPFSTNYFRDRDRQRAQYFRGLMEQHGFRKVGNQIFGPDDTPYDSWESAMRAIKDEQDLAEAEQAFGKLQSEYQDLIKKGGAELQELAETKAARQGGHMTRMMQNALMASGEDPGRVQALMGRSQAATQRGLQDVLRGIQAQTTGQLAGAKRFEIGTDLSLEDLETQRKSLADAMAQFLQNKSLEEDKIQAQLDMQPEWWEGALGDTAGGLSEAAMMYFMAGCWIAEAIFGERHIKTHMARFYINSDICPAWLYAGYMKHGRKIAEKVKRSKLLQWVLRPVFEYFAYRGWQLLSKEVQVRLDG